MSRTYSKSEYDSLERRRRLGWAKYYKLLEEQTSMVNVIVVPYRNNETGEMKPQNSLPKHITNEFYEMACKLNKEYTCPICLDLVDKDTIDITICGHTFHKECLIQSKEVKNECPTCRKKFY
jgi:UDP-2,3-diacylglucosamine pyrophosphatase LpxH